jgi:hypothetical protein
MNKFQAFGSFLSLAMFPFLFTLAKSAFAEAPPCRDIATPQIGNTCYNELSINARSGPNDASSDHGEMTAGGGWSIIDWNFRNDTQFGSVEGPKYTFIEKGSAFQMKNSIDEYTRNLEEVRKKAEAEGNGSKFLADYTDKTLKEYENRRSAVSSAQTNVDVFKVDVTVRGRCLKSTILGCVDKGGGQLKGVVRVFKRYIGTLESTQAYLAETLSEARKIASESTQPIPGSVNLDNPVDQKGVPFDVTWKGANGEDSAARTEGANLFCKWKGHNTAIDFQFAGGSNKGTWQWDKEANRWWYCSVCGMYFTKVACQ